MLNQGEIKVPIRKQGDWMEKWDDRFLEYIQENKSGTPTEMSNSEHIPVSKQNISKRLRKLCEHNLIECLGNGVYIMAPRGTSYLQGEYNAQEESYS